MTSQKLADMRRYDFQSSQLDKIIDTEHYIENNANISNQQYLTLSSLSRGSFNKYPGRKYLDIVDISEAEVWEYLKSSNNDLVEPIWSFLDAFKHYFVCNKMNYRLSLHLDEFYGENHYKVVVIGIETNIDDLKQELFLIREIGKLMDKITQEILSIKGKEFNAKLAHVTYLIGEL